MDSTIEKAMQVYELAKAGISYDSFERQALCPWCGKKLLVNDVRRHGNHRIRYHKCSDAKCFLGASQTTIKSVETKGSQGPGGEPSRINIEQKHGEYFLYVNGHQVGEELNHRNADFLGRWLKYYWPDLIQTAK